MTPQGAAARRRWCSASPGLPEHRIAEAVRLLAEAAAATRVGRAH
jgi:hypothetical protein